MSHLIGKLGSDRKTPSAPSGKIQAEGVLKWIDYVGKPHVGHRCRLPPRRGAMRTSGIDDAHTAGSTPTLVGAGYLLTYPEYRFSDPALIRDTYFSSGHPSGSWIQAALPRSESICFCQFGLRCPNQCFVFAGPSLVFQLPPVSSLGPCAGTASRFGCSSHLSYRQTSNKAIGASTSKVDELAESKVLVGSAVSPASTPTTSLKFLSGLQDEFVEATLTREILLDALKHVVDKPTEKSIPIRIVTVGGAVNTILRLGHHHRRGFLL
ncbi:hypothetical protein DFH07DRAFT_782756 [Mycena maculata]|uniref:Uncharacterized protein n=1 Tax=Mycena maculata TaxID=230809 RepID=A0AAD7HSN3_9AGAR|nr:hypothetical protein DFH07DRAFT_782756 [Mycena maculata]